MNYRTIFIFIFLLAGCGSPQIAPSSTYANHQYEAERTFAAEKARDRDIQNCQDGKGWVRGQAGKVIGCQISANETYMTRISAQDRDIWALMHDEMLAAAADFDKKAIDEAEFNRRRSAAINAASTQSMQRNLQRNQAVAMHAQLSQQQAALDAQQRAAMFQAGAALMAGGGQPPMRMPITCRRFMDTVTCN